VHHQRMRRRGEGVGGDWRREMKVEGEGRHVVLRRLAANLSGKSRGTRIDLACMPASSQYGPPAYSNATVGRLLPSILSSLPQIVIYCPRASFVLHR
jgi:hypothetical protein